MKYSNRLFVFGSFVIIALVGIAYAVDKTDSLKNPAPILNMEASLKSKAISVNKNDSIAAGSQSKVAIGQQKNKNIQSLFDRNSDLVEKLGDNDFYNPWAYIYPKDTTLTVMVLKAYQIRLDEIKAFYDLLYAKKAAEKAEVEASKLIKNAKDKIDEAQIAANQTQDKLEDDIRGTLLTTATFHKLSITEASYQAKVAFTATASLQNWKDPVRFPPQQIRVKPYRLQETVDTLSNHFEFKDISKAWKNIK